MALFFKANGFDIVPVNPNETVVHGADAVADLGQIDGHVDIVNVFRRPEHCVRHRAGGGRDRRQCALAATGAFAMTRRWRLPRAGGLKAVQDRCLRVEVQRLLRRR